MGSSYQFPGQSCYCFFYYPLLFRLVEGVKVFILHGKMHSRRHRVFTDFADTDVCVAS